MSASQGPHLQVDRPADMRAILWVPVIRVAADLAKMQGFVAGTLGTSSGPARFR
jgi:hypothetical protein